jgi:flagellar protein FlaG
MDGGFQIKPAAVMPAASGITRPDTGVLRAAVRTELPATQSVTAATDSDAASARFQNQPQPQRRPEWSYVLDPQARELVLRAVDPRTGRVLRQIPEEALLKLRAYLREDGERKTRGPNGRAAGPAVRAIERFV